MFILAKIFSKYNEKGAGTNSDPRERDKQMG
jgi:hypothetical protein